MSTRTLAPPAVTTYDPPQWTHRADVQGLRAVAVVAVIAFHVGLPLPGGFTGVDVFFVISGFVITGMLLRQHQRHGRVDLRQFFIRRFKRLAPALALTISVTLALGSVILSPLGQQQATAKTALGALALSANLVIARTTGGYFDASATSNPLLNIWSLSVEEQFYLVFPIILILGLTPVIRRGFSSHAPILLVSATALLSFALALWGASGTISSYRLSLLLGFYSPVTRAWEFAVGALIALSASGLHHLSRRMRELLALIGAAGLLMSFFLIGENAPFPGVWTLLPVAGTAAILVAGTGGQPVLSRLLSRRAPAHIGDLSYSLYLWHWPFIVLAMNLGGDGLSSKVAGAVVSLPLAMASYHLVEQPLKERDLPSLFAFGRLVVATALPPLLLTVALVTISERFWIPMMSSFHSATTTPHISSERCATASTLAQGPTNECQWNAEAPGKPVYLLGDSNAEHFSEAVIDAGRTLDRSVFIVAPGGCPFVDSSLIRTSRPLSESKMCHDTVTSTMKWLEGQPQGTVVLSLSERWWHDPYLIASPSGGSSNTSKAVTDVPVIGPALEKMVHEFVAMGYHVVLVQSVPHFAENVPWPYPQPYAWSPKRCTPMSILSNKCASSMPRDHLDDYQQVSRQWLNRVAEKENAQVLDISRFFCTATECSTQLDGIQVYRDSSHLSVPAAHRLAPEFERVLRQAG